MKASPAHGVEHGHSTCFERRELTPYAEPVDVEILREGRIYFMVQFIDDQMFVPAVEPVAYIGCNREPGDSNQIYFQDAASYIAGARYGQEDNQAGTIYRQEKNEVNHIFEFERGLDVVLRCALRRRQIEDGTYTSCTVL